MGSVDLSAVWLGKDVADAAKQSSWRWRASTVLPRALRAITVYIGMAAAKRGGGASKISSHQKAWRMAFRAATQASSRKKSRDSAACARGLARAAARRATGVDDIEIMFSAWTPRVFIALCLSVRTSNSPHQNNVTGGRASVKRRGDAAALDCR